MTRLLAWLAVGLTLAAPGAAQVGVTFDEIIEAESALAAEGYDPGPPNGVIGERTTRALREYQADWGLPQTGVLTPELHARLVREHPDTRPQWFPTSSGCDVWNDYPQPRETASWSGACADGRLAGEGTLVWRWMHRGAWQEQRHQGSFRGGRKHGYGINSYAYGGRYEGEFREGERHGHGTRILPDGTRYEGEWREGLPNGQGTVYMPDGRVFSGVWSEGCLEGHAISFETAPAYCGY